MTTIDTQAEINQHLAEATPEFMAAMSTTTARKQTTEAYALTLEKRRLETLLREFRIPARLARTVTFHFFNDKKATNDR